MNSGTRGPVRSGICGLAIKTYLIGKYHEGHTTYQHEPCQNAAKLLCPFLKPTPSRCVHQSRIPDLIQREDRELLENATNLLHAPQSRHAPNRYASHPLVRFSDNSVSCLRHLGQMLCQPLQARVLRSNFLPPKACHHWCYPLVPSGKTMHARPHTSIDSCSSTDATCCSTWIEICRLFSSRLNGTEIRVGSACLRVAGCI